MMVLCLLSITQTVTRGPRRHGFIPSPWASPPQCHFSSYFIKQLEGKDTGRNPPGVSGLAGWVMLDTDIDLAEAPAFPISPTLCFLPPLPPPIIPSFFLSLHVGG